MSATLERMKRALITDATRVARNRCENERRSMGVYYWNDRAYVRPLADPTDAGLVPGGLPEIPLTALVAVVERED